MLTPIATYLFKADTRGFPTFQRVVCHCVLLDLLGRPCCTYGSVDSTFSFIVQIFLTCLLLTPNKEGSFIATQYKSFLHLTIVCITKQKKNFKHLNCKYKKVVELIYVDVLNLVRLSNSRLFLQCQSANINKTKHKGTSRSKLAFLTYIFSN